MRNLINGLLAVALVAAVAGCGPTVGTGVIVGFVVNGQTGERINFYDSNNLTDKADSSNQVYTIIDGAFVRATPCGTGFVNASDKVQGDGCYKISGVPYGSELPIFAVHDGFEKFHGVYTYPEALVDDNGVAHPTPQVVENIRLFPKTYTVAYKILADWQGRGINTVTVACQIRQDTVKLTTDGTHFIPAANTVSQTLTGQTGNDATLGDGYFTIQGSDLVLGADYHCTAFMPAGLYNNVGALNGTVDFVAGVDAPEVALVLDEAKTPDPDLVYAINSNADDNNTVMGATAKLVINFNRAVEVVPGSADCQTYSIIAPDTNGDGNLPPVPPADQVGQDGSEQVAISSSNSDMTLTISFKPPTNSFDKNDVGSAVTFAGIYIRPKGSQTDAELVRKIGQQANMCSAGTLLRNAATLKSTVAGTQTATILIF